MCGICGFAGVDGDEDLLSRMMGVIAHRGPDDQGYYCNGRIGAGVRRLSIIDVSGGQQPIFNEDGSLAVLCNGEIYNYRELTDILVKRGHTFRTRSDAEAIVHLYEEYGSECVQHLQGMFAFCICDVRRQRLFLARDRLGIKPLYYWHAAGKLVFGSEIKAILECDDVPREPHLPAINAYLSLRYVPGPETMFAGIRKLSAGHWLTWQNGVVDIQRYWAPRLDGGPYQSDQHYRDRFAELLTESVRARLQSDVPIGAFLSGGIDSTALVATMAEHMERPVKTFCVGFDWAGDELPAARQTADVLGCDHHEIVCKLHDFELLPEIVWHLDEPVGDAIVLPMYLLSRAARRHVTVVLTGEGADEILAGYLPHKVLLWARRFAHWVPPFVRRRLVTPSVRRTPPALLNLAFAYPGRLGQRGRQKLADYLDMLDAGGYRDEYNFLISLFDGRDKVPLYSEVLRPFLHDSLGDELLDPPSNEAPDLERILALQYGHWLPDDILMKQDKMTMANSIEGRVPFLDHRLVEFLLQTPPHLKLHGLTDKKLLRDHLSKLMPGDSAQRPKNPFYIPAEQYIGKGPLSEIVNECLSESSVRRRGYFDWQQVSFLRGSIGAGDFLYAKQVFSLTVLELWHRIFIDREKGWTTPECRIQPERATLGPDGRSRRLS